MVSPNTASAMGLADEHGNASDSDNEVASGLSITFYSFCNQFGMYSILKITLVLIAGFNV